MLDYIQRLRFVSFHPKDKYLIQSSHRKSSETVEKLKIKKRVDFILPCVEIFPHSSQFMYSVQTSQAVCIPSENEYTSCGREYIAIQKDVTEITTVPSKMDLRRLYPLLFVPSKEVKTKRWFALRVH